MNEFSDGHVLCIVIAADYNECADDNGGCEQVCRNTVASFQCDCMEGYTLDSNGFNCTGNTAVSSS